jgi:beta-glucosidase
VRAEDSPVLDALPSDGVLTYKEGLLMGYAGWQAARTEPAYWFGHGLGYTDWAYEQAEFIPADAPRKAAADAPQPPGGAREQLGTLRVQVRNVGSRPGREVVQAYLEHAESGTPRRLAGFATVEAAPGVSVVAEIGIPRRATQTWDPAAQSWRPAVGDLRLRSGRSAADLRLSTPV